LPSFDALRLRERALVSLRLTPDFFLARFAIVAGIVLQQAQNASDENVGAGVCAELRGYGGD
jgi:hypothetical protein